MKWTNSAAISAATLRPRSSRFSTRSRTSTFRDNYLDVPFDLSRVLFITTANMLDTIPEALRDRMEIIELQGYTEQEKVMIAFRYLIPRQKKENGLDEDRPLVFDGRSRAVYRPAIHPRSRCPEPRARNRNRLPQSGSPLRRSARARHRDHASLVEEFLGAPRFRPDTEVAERTRRPGVAVGLAWTPVGGDVLFIEAGRMPGGSKGLIMTGQLGSVMQESVQAALTWVRANAPRYGDRSGRFQNQRHPRPRSRGRNPKDGPSAGVTMATALLSMLTERCVRENLAMTGEITLTGQVCRWEESKKKCWRRAASGVKEVILPADNEVNVREDLKTEQISDMTMHYVKTMDELVPLALVERNPPSEIPPS